MEGTRSLHILEPLGSQAKYEQIIGRTVRLNSHIRLPKNERNVMVYSWECTLSGLDAYLAKNNNWAKRFYELNSIASFGNGQAQIDGNSDFKAMSPDEFTTQKRYLISNAMSSLIDLFKSHSIELGAL